VYKIGIFGGFMEFVDILIAYKLTEDLLNEFDSHDIFGLFNETNFELPKGMIESFKRIYDDIEELNEELFNLKVAVKENDQ